MHYDVAIIGAGLSGLAAGVRIANFGKRVCILEKHSVWGGLNSFYKKDGHHFDVGLHAITNYVPPDDRKTERGPRNPLARVMRALRIRADELELEPQTYSEIVFGSQRLRFENGLDVLTLEVAEKFPHQVDGFRRLAQRCAEYPDPTAGAPRVSSRRVLAELISDPLLADMLLCPLMWYGSAEEDDLDFESFIILFNSVYREGFCRPRRGIRQILDVLVRKYEEAGGELRRRCGVERIVVQKGRVAQLELESGEPVTADLVLSSAGLVETERLRSDGNPRPEDSGQLGFLEQIWILDRDPKELGYTACVTFFNAGERFRWRRPDAPLDLTSGVICCPSNYAHREPLEQKALRATHLADHRFWFGLDREGYEKEKRVFADRSESVILSRAGDFSQNVVYRDTFTPRTVHHFTSKENGAIYGSPNKKKTGATGVSNLVLIGTDQGLVGIVGAMLSGIAMANKWGL